MDSALRRSPGQLWLNENRIELTEADKEAGLSAGAGAWLPWVFMVLGLIAVGGCVAAVYYKSYMLNNNDNENNNENDNDNENEKPAPFVSSMPEAVRRRFHE